MENYRESEAVAAARKSIIALEEDRARAASRVRAPLWWRVAFAPAVGAFVGAFSVEESTFMVVITGSAIVTGLLGVIRPRVTGTQADPWSGGPALRWGVVQMLMVLIIGAAGVLVFTITGMGWVLWICAVLVGATCFWSGTRMENSFAHSIRTDH